MQTHLILYLWEKRLKKYTRPDGEMVPNRTGVCIIVKKIDTEVTSYMYSQEYIIFILDTVRGTKYVPYESQLSGVIIHSLYHYY